ncbi:MAG TPA: arylsulfotransferase family protein, partial [Acidimicrobiales bacterium]|nr:arylsulfotransferase family protein [Acidimicrobiales bacterium]
GQVLATVVSPDYGNADIHDIQPMANGDYLMDVYPTTSGVDMSSIGGPASTCVVDGAVEEVSPTGTLVWKWLLSQHLSPTEINKEIQATAAGSTCASPKDVWHLNSVADEGSDVLISVRYAGLYLIDKASGNILWKLGGSTTSNSLTIVGDSATPAGGLGQHDARIEPDGTVSFFDNGNVGNVKSSEARSPRVVSYTVSTGISPTVGTATLATSITDPAITTSSACCGSARQLSAGGDWVIGWGIDNIETEVTSGGSRVFSLTGPSSGLYTYRFLPVAAGVLSPAALRSDMDAMYPPTPGWRVDAAPQAGTASQFNAVQALNDSDVWAAGSYVLGGVSWPFVDHWTGPTGGWQVLPAAKGGSSSTFTSMSVLGDSDVWAAGSYVLSGVAWPFVEQWNGTTWNVLAAPKSGTSSVFNAIKAVSDTNIWVSGYYVQGGVNHPLVDHWNGVTWQVLPAAQGGSASQFNSITVLGNNDVWAGGWYVIGNSNLSFVERWNGSSWSVLAAPQAGTSSQFNAMTALGDSDVWAAGAYVLGGVTSPFVDQWNGTTWNVLAAPQAGTSSQFNAMAVLSDTDVWTAGSYLQSGASAPLVDHWNGSTWQVLVPPIAGSASQFNGLSVLSDTDLWGAGAYSQGGTNWPFLEQFGVGPT